MPLRASMWLSALLLLAACERVPASNPHRVARGCGSADTARLDRVARDTIAKLRGRTQFVRRVTPLPAGISVRTEDGDSTEIHDGGLVSFGCDGRITLIWLDGG